jgi:hypothetical protein
MRRSFSVRRLTARQAAQAFPLIQSIAPDLRLEDWKSFSTQPATEDMGTRGVIAARDERNYICGLACYHVVPHLRGRRLLIADHLIALDLVDRGGAIAALLGALEELAMLEKCGAVQAPAPYVAGQALEVDVLTLAVLCDAGFAREGLQLSKQLGRNKRNSK